jgi:hypothetical protein
MKRSATLLKGQLNLPLLDAPVTMVASGDHQKELTVALVELLIHAAQGELKVRTDGGGNESPEAHP